MPSLHDAMTQVPKSVSGNSSWAEAYGLEMKKLLTDYAARAPRSVQRHLGPSELGEECLSGDTLIVTRNGLRKIEDFAGTEVELLVPMRCAGSEVRKRWGKFATAPVTCFGERETFVITLRSLLGDKEVTATAGHNWYRQYWSGKQRKQERLTTADLRPGHKLTTLQAAMPHSAGLLGVAVAQGFAFGDGTGTSSRPDGRVNPDFVMIYENGKDEAVLRFFLPDAIRDVKHLPERADRGQQLSHVVGPLPKHWKRLPDIRESRDFLVSWLAGYFAADGSVGGEDGACSISSARREHLEFVRNLAAVCGIRYGQITTTIRQGISGKRPDSRGKTPLYKLALNRRDLPEWFFVTQEHAKRAAIANSRQERPFQWTVVSVVPTGRTEPVYCATVEGVRAFALADNLMTGNCDRQVVMKMVGSDKLPRTNNISDPWASVMGTAGHAYVENMYAWDNLRRLGDGTFPRWIPETRVTPDPGPDPHPGTADLYDAQYRALVDHKFLGKTSMAKLISAGKPKRVYYVQLLLYRRGYQYLGLPVDKIVLLAWPRTESSLDKLYVWEHIPDASDEALVDEVLQQTAERQQLAELVKAGHLDIMDIKPVPSDDSCHFCPLYRSQAAYDGSYGCPGTLLLTRGKT